MMNVTPLVEGRIVFDVDVPAFTGATVRATIEDVSVMDSSARVLAESVKSVTYDGTPIAFSITGDNPDLNHQYNVRVHISQDGSADIKKGNFISTQSYPVLTQGNPNKVTVHVRKV